MLLLPTLRQALREAALSLPKAPRRSFRQAQRTAAVVCSPAAGPHEILERQEALELLRGEMAQLPLKARLALTLQVKGASLKEIQDALGISEDAAAQLLSRARALLRNRLR